MTHPSIFLGANTPLLIITEAVLRSELRCVAVANKLMEHGFFATDVRTYNSTIARISNSDWAIEASHYIQNSISPTEREHFVEYPLAHIYRTFCESYTPTISTNIARFMKLSRDVPGRYE